MYFIQEGIVDIVMANGEVSIGCCSFVYVAFKYFSKREKIDSFDKSRTLLFDSLFSFGFDSAKIVCDTKLNQPSFKELSQVKGK